MRISKKTATIITATVFGIAGLGACDIQATHVTTPPKPPSMSAPAQIPAPVPKSTYNLAIGSTIKVKDDSTGSSWTVTVNSIHGYAPGPYDEAAPAGMTYVEADVTYVVLTGSADYNALDWTVKNPAGQSNESTLMTGQTNKLVASTLQAGQRVEGTVVAPVTTGTGGTFVYSWPMSEQGSWKFTAAEATP